MGKENLETYQDISRWGWKTSNDANKVTNDTLKTGALLRIAESLEPLSKFFLMLNKGTECLEKEIAGLKNQMIQDDKRLEHWQGLHQRAYEQRESIAKELRALKRKVKPEAKDKPKPKKKGKATGGGNGTKGTH
jgi:hypothetical protein